MQIKNLHSHQQNKWHNERKTVVSAVSEQFTKTDTDENYDGDGSHIHSVEFEVGPKSKWLHVRRTGKWDCFQKIKFE